MKELILNNLEKEELAIMQEEFLKISKEKRCLKMKISNYISDHTTNTLKIKPDIIYINRDLDLVYEYIKLNGPSLTIDLCIYIDKTLENDFKRWNVNNLKNLKLDTGSFYGFMSLKMKYDNRFLKDGKYCKIN
jgi:hypothetical protein